MASIPPTLSLSPAHLMSLGLFVFGMDTLPYQSMRRQVEWRHGTSERHMARPASQYLGRGAETVTIGGLIVPEIAGRYSCFDRLEEMADSGDDYALMDGTGDVLGHFRILRMDRDYLGIMAGGLPRQVAFSLDLERGDDVPPSSGAV